MPPEKSKRRVQTAQHFQKVPRKKPSELLFGKNSKVGLGPVGNAEDTPFTKIKSVPARKMGQTAQRESGFREDDLDVAVFALLVKDHRSGEVIPGIRRVQMGYHLLNAKCLVRAARREFVNHVLPPCNHRGCGLKVWTNLMSRMLASVCTYDGR